MEISVYSDDQKYHYLSEERISDSSDRELLVIMLNPATTIETAGDPNRRRHARSVCRNFALRRGFGELTVANLFAFRAANPRELFKAADPIGLENDEWISKAAARAAWFSSHGAIMVLSGNVLLR